MALHRGFDGLVVCRPEGWQGVGVDEVRRAAEMRESAATYDELGFVGALAEKIADVQERMGSIPATDLPDGPLAQAVSEIAKLRRGPTRG